MTPVLAIRAALASPRPTTLAFVLPLATTLLLSLATPAVSRAQSSPDDAACQPPAPPRGPLSSAVRLAPVNEPGEPMELVLRFRNTSGTPLRQLLVYVYHTNAAGLYVPAAGATGCLRFHGALHAWARPDSRGVVTVRSIRPGEYPRSTEPAHVHVVVQFPERRGFYLNDTMFEGDPRLTPAVRAAQQAPGGSGIVSAVRGDDGVWRATRDVVLTPPPSPRTPPADSRPRH